MPTPARYQALFELASGGMGVVYAAQRREGDFERLCAMKRLLEPSEESQAMFLDEARLAASISHPNVVPVTDFGQDDEGPFLIMPLIEGTSLRGLMKGLRAQDRPLPVQLVLFIGEQIAQGLAAAHEARDGSGEPLDIVHRDLSPQNVLLGFDGSVRITDFGVARAKTRSTETTQLGIIKGKIGYLSPEQLRFRKPDARSDLFALGVVLFELASGKRLYAGEDAPLRILEEPPPNLRVVRRDVSAAFRDLVRGLLAKSPDARPGSAREVAAALHRQYAECVVEEGRLELGALIEELFPNAQRELRERIRQAREANADAKTSSDRRWPRWAAAAAAMLIAGGGVALALRSAEPDDANPVEAAPLAAPPVAIEAPPTDEAPESEAIAQAVDDAPEQASAAPEQTSEAPTMRRRRRRIRRPARMRPAPMRTARRCPEGVPPELCVYPD
ncbi:MAG: serine/threonine-protein kinase [Myxococcota bacterium]